MASTADVAIIGGGIVGCSVLFELNRLGYDCILLEKNDNLISEASSGNSGMLHTGFDAPADSVELHCIKLCLQRVFKVMDTLTVPYSNNGAIMVAWSPEQVKKLDDVRTSSLAKGVDNLQQLSLPELYQREPHLSRQACGALNVPDETVLEPCVYGLLLAHHARRNGAQLRTGCEVEGCDVSSSGTSTLRTTRGPVSARVVINCAGLYGDHVQHMAGINTFSIKPRKGQYAVFGSGAGHLIQSSILPVPTEKTKGIIVFKTVHDNLVVGPTAEDVEGRGRAAVEPAITRRLLDVGGRTVPPLTARSPVGHYTGVRPATHSKDYLIKPYVDRNWITVGGIRSTGVSASLGIAEYVAGMVQTDLGAEPSRGSSGLLGASDWNLLPARNALCVDGQEYGISHPITLFGMREAGRNSRL